MWTRRVTEISVQMQCALFLVVLAIFCSHSNAARLPVSSSGDLRFGSNTVTFKGDLTVAGTSVLDSFTSFDTTLVQADLYNLYRLNALRVQQLAVNITSTAVFSDSVTSAVYMAATVSPSSLVLYKWSNTSQSFTQVSTTTATLTGVKSVKYFQTNASETYVLVCSSSGNVATYKLSTSNTLNTLGFATNAPPVTYGLSVGSNDAAGVQHSSGTIFYTQMTPLGYANNIYRTVSTLETPVWSGDNNAASASTFFTISSTLYAAIGYSNVNNTQIVYTSNGLTFTNLHNVTTYQVVDIDTFVSGSNTYMLITESVSKYKAVGNATQLVTVSEVYKWNGTGFSKLSGDVIVQNPMNSRIFTFQSNTFLVVANYYGSSTDVSAQLFRWNKVVEEFTLICSITNVSKNFWWEAFTADGKNYLVLNSSTKTFVYKLNLN